MTFTTKSLTAIAFATGIAATGAQAQEATFGMVDTNDNGYLSQDELSTAFGDVGMTLLRYDADEDGRLTPQEIEARNQARAETGEADDTSDREQDMFDDAELSDDDGDNEFGNAGVLSDDLDEDDEDDDDDDDEDAGITDPAD